MNDLRKRFIEDATRLDGIATMDFRTSNTPGQEGRFLDKKTHLMWRGYALAHRAGHRGRDQDDESCITGTYIIGRHVGPGVKLIMSHRPYINKTRQAAYEEAARLAETLGDTFAVFRCVKTFTTAVKDEPVVG